MANNMQRCLKVINCKQMNMYIVYVLTLFCRRIVGLVWLKIPMPCVL